MMNEASSSFSNEDKDMEWLLQAFGSKLSIDEMASAYYEAEYDLHKASDILCNLLENSSNNGLTSQPSSSSSSSSVGSNDIQGVHVGPTSSVNGRGSSNNEPSKVTSRWKPKNSGVSVGTVSSIIGADYGKLRRGSTRETCESTKPVKLMSKDFPAPQIWGEKTRPVNSTPPETMNKDVEEFMMKMLGDGFKLDKEVIREVLGGCGYDVKESTEKLLDISSTKLGLEGVTSDKNKSMEKSKDLNINCHENFQFSNSVGRSNLENDVLRNLFNVPERFKIGTQKLQPRREPRTRKYGLVTGPLEDQVSNFTAPIVMTNINGNGNEQTEDNYETLMEAKKEYYITMEQYYRAAADAYVKGNDEVANKLIEEGHFFMAKARNADETTASMLTQTKDDGEAIAIDFNDYDSKEAIRFLKLQLKSMAGIPAVQYMKITVGTHDDITKRNARKRLIIKFLEKETISWTEEQDGQIMVIRIDVINPKQLSFNKK